jgi:aspartate kinase
MGATTDELIALMKQVSPQVFPREYDQLVSTGENISAALLAMAIQDAGEKALSLTGWQAGVVTEDIPMRGKIINIGAERIKQELDAGKIVVITGFQGRDSAGNITTIGRGGSDTSAVAIAAAINADICEIYTDVDGVYTTDPRVVPEAKKLESISHEEMLEMASLGAGVMHPRSVETGKINKMNIDVKHAHRDVPGTRITLVGENSRPVSGVAGDDNVAKIGVMHVPDIPGVAATLFGALAKDKINVDVIVQSTHETAKTNDISFTVSKDDYAKAEQLVKDISAKWPGVKITGDKKVAKISIIGIGMVSTPGVAAKMFTALGKAKINIQMISTSEIKVSCIIAEADLNKAVKTIHAEFQLDK